MNASTLHTVAIVSLVISFACCLIIILDILNGHQQHMSVMNFVYPITALYSGPLGLVVYYTVGRKSTHQSMMPHGKSSMHTSEMNRPFWQSAGLAALHCGSGCTLGDIIAEAFLLFVPISLFGMRLYGAWVFDYILAFAIGILFQYYSIKPMKGLSHKEAFIASLKADSLSLSFWQIGMYGWMAISTFLIFGRELKATDPVFWFMMQIGMLCGFLTAYPINWWLLKKGIKEAM